MLVIVFRNVVCGAMGPEFDIIGLNPGTSAAGAMGAITAESSYRTIIIGFPLVASLLARSPVA